MRIFCLALMLLVFTGTGNPAAATGNVGAVDRHGGRLGVLPPSWVDTLERNHISEQTAVVVAGATGATLFVLWLAQWPLRIAPMGGGGYLAWNYLWTDEPGAAPPTTVKQPSIRISY